MLRDQFLQHGQTQKNFSLHTLEAYRHDLGELAEYLALQGKVAGIDSREAVQQVTHKHLRSWLAALMKSGLSPRSVARKLASVKSFFGYLHRQQILDANPAERVQTPRFSKKLPAFVPEKELSKLLDDIPFPQDFEGIRDRCILELLYGCGIRRAELISLKMSDIDLYTQQLKVRGKGNKDRIVPFGKAVAKALAAYSDARKQLGYEQKSTLILRKNGDSAYPALIQRVLYKYLSLIDAPKQKSPHVLRHSYATHLLDGGADLQAIKELLGHSSLAATQVYTHHSLARLKNIHTQAHPRSETDKD
ncbi:MAG: tyrosine-type recombinase/integrase [Bacteroidia bacterium]|nr:tyrosine-type recombinase/integrase [Bacteroidia bacterium]